MKNSTGFYPNEINITDLIVNLGIKAVCRLNSIINIANLIWIKDLFDINSTINSASDTNSITPKPGFSSFTYECIREALKNYKYNEYKHPNDKFYSGRDYELYIMNRIVESVSTIDVFNTFVRNFDNITFVFNINCINSFSKRRHKLVKVEFLKLNDKYEMFIDSEIIYNSVLYSKKFKDYHDDFILAYNRIPVYERNSQYGMYYHYWQYFGFNNTDNGRKKLLEYWEDIEIKKTIMENFNDILIENNIVNLDTIYITSLSPSFKKNGHEKFKQLLNKIKIREISLL